MFSILQAADIAKRDRLDRLREQEEKEGHGEDEIADNDVSLPENNLNDEQEIIQNTADDVRRTGGDDRVGSQVHRQPDGQGIQGVAGQGVGVEREALGNEGAGRQGDAGRGEHVSGVPVLQEAGADKRTLSELTSDIRGDAEQFMLSVTIAETKQDFLCLMRK